MNRYQRMVEGIPVPEEQKERLKAAALAAEPEKRRRTRLRGPGRKGLLAAVLAVCLLIPAVAASEAVDWAPAFLEIFGPASQSVPGAGGVFQDVSAVGVCGDVTLTVGQAIGDKRNLYLLLDYQLPEDTDLEAVAAAEDLRPPRILVYKGRGIAWEDVEEFSSTEEAERELGTSSVSGQVTRTLGFDPETRSLTVLVQCDLAEWSLAARVLNAPVTLVAGPPVMAAGGEEVPLADHLAVVSFTPSFEVRPVRGSVKTEGASYRAEVSHLSLHVRMKGEELPGWSAGDAMLSEFKELLVLRFRDGTETTVSVLEQPGGSSNAHASRTHYDDGRVSGTVTLNLVFETFLNPAEVEAVLVGDVEIPVS